MRYEKWVDTFQPIKNHFTKSAEIDGYVFGARGREGDFVRTHPELNVWSFVVVDGYRNSTWIICDGYHTVNLMGYLVTKNPRDPKKLYEIRY